MHTYVLFVCSALGTGASAVDNSDVMTQITQLLNIPPIPQGSKSQIWCTAFALNLQVAIRIIHLIRDIRYITLTTVIK